MTFWLDAQLPPDLALWIGSQFQISIKHLKEVGLAEEKDEVIFQAATRFPNIVIVTKDVGFATMIKTLGPPPKVIQVNCGNMTLIQTQLYFRNRFGSALETLQNGANAAEM